ncbi:MAG: hypothetical protein ACRD9L_16650, partial [Bryobacteraceae bacterium]
MAITRSWERPAVSLKLAAEPAPPERRVELLWLVGASFLVTCGLALVFFAKTQEFSNARARLASAELLNLNTVADPAGIVPFLGVFTDPEERELAAEKTFAYVRANHPLPNVGALGRLRNHAQRLLPLARLKAAMVVRRPRDFVRQYLAWCAVYLASFWMVHLLWRWRRFRGDPAILPAIHLLTGIGLI